MPLQTLSITRRTNIFSADLVCWKFPWQNVRISRLDSFIFFSLPLSHVHIVLPLLEVKVTCLNCKDLPKAEELPELSHEAVGRIAIQKNCKFVARLATNFKQMHHLSICRWTRRIGCKTRWLSMPYARREPQARLELSSYAVESSSQSYRSDLGPLPQSAGERGGLDPWVHCAQWMFAVSIGADEVDDLLLPVSRRCRLDRKISIYLITFQAFLTFWDVSLQRNQEI